jgi:methyl-accepting chemotaxis protein
VVADEVRKLAERTAKSTAEITALISAIQSGTIAAVTAMHAGVEGVSESRVMTAQAGDSMQTIRSGAEQVNCVVGDIATALREQSAAITDIAQRVEQIAQMAEETTTSVATNADTARHLELLAQTLQEEVQRFTL